MTPSNDISLPKVPSFDTSPVAVSPDLFEPGPPPLSPEERKRQEVIDQFVAEALRSGGARMNPEPHRPFINLGYYVQAKLFEHHLDLYPSGSGAPAGAIRLKVDSSYPGEMPDRPLVGLAGQMLHGNGTWFGVPRGFVVEPLIVDEAPEVPAQTPVAAVGEPEAKPKRPSVYANPIFIAAFALMTVLLLFFADLALNSPSHSVRVTKNADAAITGKALPGGLIAHPSTEAKTAQVRVEESQPSLAPTENNFATQVDAALAASPYYFRSHEGWLVPLTEIRDTQYDDFRPIADETNLRVWIVGREKPIYIGEKDFPAFIAKIRALTGKTQGAPTSDMHRLPDNYLSPVRPMGDGKNP
jgi:hypothetical protein